MPAEEKKDSTLIKDLYTSEGSEPHEVQKELPSSVPEPESTAPSGQGVVQGQDQGARGGPEKDEISWTAPARPFKRRDREFWVTVIAMAGVVGIILFLVEGFMPVILVISIVFLFYVLSTVEPENVEYKITSRGIRIGGRLTEWANMNRFWMSRRFNSELLVVETFILPGRLELVVDPEKKELIQKAMSKYLNHEEVPPSGLDKAANWIGKRMPGGK